MLEELHQRGIGLQEPLSEQHFAILVDAVTTSPRRAAARALLGEGKSMFHLAQEFIRSAEPRWASTPTGIPSLISWRDDQEEVTVDIRAQDIPTASRGVLQRLFDQTPHQPKDPDKTEKAVVRPCSYWLDWDPATGSERGVNVHLGNFTLTPMPGPHDILARRLIAHHGGTRHAIGLFAEITGRNLIEGHLTLHLPDRP